MPLLPCLQEYCVTYFLTVSPKGPASTYTWHWLVLRQSQVNYVATVISLWYYQQHWFQSLYSTMNVLNQCPWSSASRFCFFFLLCCLMLSHLPATFKRLSHPESVSSLLKKPRLPLLIWLNLCSFHTCYFTSHIWSNQHLQTYWELLWHNLTTYYYM